MIRKNVFVLAVIVILLLSGDCTAEVRQMYVTDQTTITWDPSLGRLVYMHIDYWGTTSATVTWQNNTDTDYTWDLSSISRLKFNVTAYDPVTNTSDTILWPGFASTIITVRDFCTPGHTGQTYAPASGGVASYDSMYYQLFYPNDAMPWLIDHLNAGSAVVFAPFGFLSEREWHLTNDPSIPLVKDCDISISELAISPGVATGIFFQYEPVPEPSALVTLIIGCAGLYVMYRRHLRRAISSTSH